MKKIILIYLISFGFVFAQSKTGSSAAPFLNVAIGARPIAMGGAFSATANDVSALYWNPAGVSRIAGSEAMFSYSTWFADINYNWSGAAINLGGMGTVGLSVTYLDYGSMEVTTLAEQDGTGQMFDANDIALGLTYAYNLTDKFSIGGTAKYIEQRIWNSSATSVAFDLGVLYYSDIMGLRIGASISNFGSDMSLSGKDLLVQHDIDLQIEGNNEQILATLNTDSYPLPLLFRIGLAMDVIKIEDHVVSIGIDALHPNDNDESLNVGLEYVLYDLLALRGGYKSLFLDNTEEGLTLGAGIKYNFAPGLGFYFDYAYQDFGIFENTQHFTLGLRF
ncbi:MAG: PorV/PorQ family protein [Ignavibacteriales bacterium]|nr:PorV/PorQ family protein [Ignavibacteriales bacterium]